MSAIRDKSYVGIYGSSLRSLSEVAQELGLRTSVAKMTWRQLQEEAPTPFIAHWNNDHFVVVYKIRKNKVYVADPAKGKLVYSLMDFTKGWIGRSPEGVGMGLFVEPTPQFYSYDEEPTSAKRFAFWLTYLKPYRKLFIQVFLGLILSSLLQLVFPFTTQAVVDYGINTRNIQFIYLILIAQAVLTVSSAVVGFIQGWLYLHIGARISIALISDFLAKVMRLPLSFFDSKKVGDILQRIGDHKRIQSFLTGSALSMLLGVFHFLIFGIIIAFYSLSILWVFLIGNLVYAGWVLLFMKKRKQLDLLQFERAAENQTGLIQIVTGIQEIKLNNIETEKRWEWEQLQVKLYRLGIRSLSLNQYQSSGALLINQFKNLVITYMAARSVIDGDMTLGMMVSMQYMLGQLQGPIDQFIGFTQTVQDAKLSLERLSEIHEHPNEQVEIREPLTPSSFSIHLHQIGFQYHGPHSKEVLKNISFSIPEKKITAIVGSSGSGKTTLLKLLLKFYVPVKGKITVGNTPLNEINIRWWRDQCGSVMQDGFIFTDTVLRNVVVKDEPVDKHRLHYALHVSNLTEVINQLPQQLQTKLGAEGHNLSQGQKQRILIARAIYKNPSYVFFDEATNALDATNEKIIINNLGLFFKGKTVVIVAHRLSTVRHADHIVVLDKGYVVEEGTHDTLVGVRGTYYNLIKNQLELS